MVPSSPNGPCNSGSTTSTSASAVAPPLTSVVTSERALGPNGTSTPGTSCVETSGSRVPSIRSGVGSSGRRTQEPSSAIPIGTTSNRSRSSAESTPAAVAHEIACSLLRPPKMMATRFLVTGRDYAAGPHAP